MLDRNKEEKIIMVCAKCSKERHINKKLFLDMPPEFIQEMKCPVCLGHLRIKCHVATPIVTK